MKTTAFCKHKLCILHLCKKRRQNPPVPPSYFDAFSSVRQLLHKALHDILVGLPFLHVRQGRQRSISALALQRLSQEQVADLRILGQQRAVKVGAHHIFVAHPFVAVLAVVAVAEQHIPRAGCG